MSEVNRQTRPEWIWPRADSHIVLSAAGSPDVLKTFVEPGGSCSPGVGTYGVSLWVWLEAEQRLVAPERLPRDAIRDRLLGGILPLYRSRWRAGELEVDLRLGVDAFAGRYQVADTVAARVVNRGGQPVSARVFLVLRAPGPAGGRVRTIAYTPELHGLMVNDKPAVIGLRPPSAAGCVSLAEDRRDLSQLLLKGEIPTRAKAADPAGWCGGCLAYNVHLDPGGVWEVGWDLPVWPNWTEPPAMLSSRCQLPAGDRLELLADQLRDQLVKVDLKLPDLRIHEAFHASITHLWAAWADDEARIATVCYPFGWMRDGVYILNALDKAGHHDLVRANLARLVGDPWAGGFGPEADAPGQLLWVLGEHYLLTRDTAWLRSVYACVRERCAVLAELRRCRTPYHAPQSRVLPEARRRPDGNLVAEPARHGLIQGRMDWHRPVFWVNAWALAGLRRAAELAAALDEDDDALAWSAEAHEVAVALASPAAKFGSNERDFVGAIWPTDARHPQDPATREEFDRRWRTLRLDEHNVYHGEPRWRYFELGEAHNLLRLGYRDRAKLVIEQFLRSQDAPGLYGWAEGDFTGDPSGDWRFIRGWWPGEHVDANRGSAIVPHGWVAAEMALLLRDLLVFEDDGVLVLGAGVSAEWLRDAPLGLADAPTHYGQLTWRLTPQTETRGWTLNIACDPPPPLGYRVRLPLPPSASVERDGVGIREEQGDWPVTGGDLSAVTLTILVR